MFTIATETLMYFMQSFEFFIGMLFTIFPNLDMFEIDGGETTLVVLDATSMITEEVSYRVII